jgi:hypothetical protein
LKLEADLPRFEQLGLNSGQSKYWGLALALDCDFGSLDERAFADLPF